MTDDGSMEHAEGAAPKRRHATVLLADIVGFTAGADEATAEAVTTIIDELWRGLDAVIVAHGGHVDPHAGDGLVAVWGIDDPHDDDPERAVHCALELHRALSDLAQRTGRRLAMRIGINTGPVVVTAVGADGTHTAAGDTVDIAGWLERAAPMGGILVAHETYRNVRGVFDVAQLDPLRVGGGRDPLRTYAVLAAKPRAFRVPPRGVHGVETRTVARDPELSLLRGVVGEVLVKRHARLVTVIGEPGIGKSRLLYDLDNWIELHTEFMYYFKGRAFAHRRDDPYGLLRDLLAERCEIMDGDPPTTVLDKLRAEMSGALSAAQAAVLGRWLGFQIDGLPGVGHLIVTEAAARAHLVAYLHALTTDSPIVWLLEDLHWADDESLDLIEQLVAELSNCGFLIVAAARPELVERRRGWRSGPAAELVHLGPLTDVQAAELVNEILRPALFVADELRQLVVSRAHGHPLHIEELIKLLVDDGVIDPGDGGTWMVSLERLERTRPPATLAGVLRARLGALPAGALVPLQHAAVVGREFWEGALEAMSDDPAVETPPTLDDALRRELVIRRDPSALDGKGGFSFQHALVRDATYETLPPADRPRLHLLAARWLEHVTMPRRREHLVVVAEHLRLAGDYAGAASRWDELARDLYDAGDPGPARAASDRAATLRRESGFTDRRRA